MLSDFCMESIAQVADEKRRGRFLKHTVRRTAHEPKPGEEKRNI